MSSRLNYAVVITAVNAKMSNKSSILPSLYHFLVQNLILGLIHSLKQVTTAQIMDKEQIVQIVLIYWLKW